MSTTMIESKRIALWDRYKRLEEKVVNCKYPIERCSSSVQNAMDLKWDDIMESKKMTSNDKDLLIRTFIEIVKELEQLNIEAEMLLEDQCTDPDLIPF